MLNAIQTVITHIKDSTEFTYASKDSFQCSACCQEHENLMILKRGFAHAPGCVYAAACSLANSVIGLELIKVTALLSVDMPQDRVSKLKEPIKNVLSIVLDMSEEDLDGLFNNSQEEESGDLKSVIYELIEELNPGARTDHHDLTVKALTAAGWERKDIDLYLVGELFP